VTIDLESGYGAHLARSGGRSSEASKPAAVAATLKTASPAGSLRAIAEQVDRIEHARKAG